MKTLINTTKTERKKKNKNFDKIKNLEILLVKIKFANNPDKLQNTLKELNKIHAVDKKLHELRNEILRDYDGEFGMVGSF